MDIPVELEINFIDTIHITPMTKEQRYETLDWLLETKTIKHSVDLQLIAEKCSDLNYADLDAIVLQAIKICYNNLPEKDVPLILNDDHFNKAHGTLLFF